jgi:transmembrane sensor
MSGAGPDQNRLTDEAIDLVIRLQNDPGNPVAIEMVRAWRARSPEHERIWARVTKVHGAAG